MLEDFSEWLFGIIQLLLEWFFDLVVSVLEWIVELLLWVVEKLWELILAGLAEFFEALPVPDFMSQASSYFGGIPPNVAYFLNFFAIAEGLTFITTALVIRFVIRRIPLIG